MGEPQGRLEVEWRGRERYAATWDYQLEVHGRRRAGELGDRLILVEHEPVITLGRQGQPEHLMASEQALRRAGIDFHQVERGGDITYHGPGQLVGYPIIALRARNLTVRDLMRGLEEALIRTLAGFGISAGRVAGLTGVWRGEDKLAALGVAVRGGVSFHGFALNVEPELSHFGYIVPCGITDRRVSSISRVTGRSVPLAEVIRPCVEHFAAVFGYSVGTECGYSVRSSNELK